MTAVPPPPGPSSGPGLPGSDETVVLLCSDVSRARPCPVPAAQLAAAVRRRAPGTAVLTVANLCSGPAGLPALLRARSVRRVAAGCRHGTARRGEIVAVLRRAGIAGPGICVTDLMPARRPDPLRVATQSAARIIAALARVSHADLSAPDSERLLGVAGPLSRRSLFHPGTIARQPATCWAANRCRSGEGCRECSSACPYGALAVTSAGVMIDTAACTACGACVAACRADALSLAGWSVRGIEAAAGELVADALRPGPGRVHGVAITCAHATGRVPVGADWLPLEVPSLEMVTAGWPLQILSAGTGVAFAGCSDARCASRARELDQFCAELAGLTAHGWRRLETPLGGWVPARPGHPPENAGSHPAHLSLREPAASARVLARLISPPGSAPGTVTATAAVACAPRSGIGHRRPWRVESPAVALGEITIDAGRCSACRSCATACSTGALTAGFRNGPALILSVDAALCSACGACVHVCPEDAMSLRRVADSESIAEGRRVVASIMAGARCESCGQPLADGLVCDVVGQRLAASHPQVAARLQSQRRCAGCTPDPAL